MRDQLEEAAKHRDDGYGRAQHHVKSQLPKRFYKDVGVAPVDGGFVVTLDKRPVKTPGLKRQAIVPIVAIAIAMAEEWAAQGERIDPATMPMVRLVNSALESGEAMATAFRDEVVKFAGNDLLLYRAEHPEALVAEQEAAWDPVLIALAQHFNVVFQPTRGIIHQSQPAATLARLSESLHEKNLMTLTAMVSLTGLTGSGLLVIALLYKLFTPEQVWSAAHVDEDHQAKFWGVDLEAAERRAMRRVEFDTAVKLLDFMRD